MRDIQNAQVQEALAELRRLNVDPPKKLRGGSHAGVRKRECSVCGSGKFVSSFYVGGELVGGCCYFKVAG